MIKCVLVLSLLISYSAFATSIIGTWKFTEYTYEGNTLPAPNPELDLQFTFKKNGLSILKWLRTDEDGFCQRLANYEIKNDTTLKQKTVWLNPDNDFSCAKDHEMQMGNVTETVFTIKDNKLYFELELNGKPFLYILTKLTD